MADDNKTDVAVNLLVICKTFYGARRQMHSLAYINWIYIIY